ncbi:hypothetical protein Q1695_007148 [Nippostrongylus brasiliensis]|nr:hypothetical protein Q1695_007148 [Nippostrongylus brasiliensis]
MEESNEKRMPCRIFAITKYRSPAPCGGTNKDDPLFNITHHSYVFFNKRTQDISTLTPKQMALLSSST